MPEIKRNLGVQVNLNSRDQTGPGLNSAQRNLKGFQDQVNNATQAVQALAAAGTKLAAIGAGLAALSIFPVKTAASFEKEMSAVRAVTAGTTEDFKEMEKVAKDLGAATKFTATEAAEGLRFLGMAGLTAKEAIDALEPSLTLAAAGAIEVSEAADVATNIMSAMQIPVEGLSHVMDVLANTATSSNTNVRELSEATKYVATEAATAGINIDDLAGYLGVLANNGKKGTVAGTSLRGVILALTKVTPKAQAALDRLGVQIAKNADGSVDYITTLERLRDANINLGDATDIFRRTAAGSAIALANSIDQVRKFAAANEKADGVAREMATTMEDNLIGAITQLNSALEGLRIALGTPLLEPIKNVVEELTKYVRILRDIVKAHPEATKVILSATGIVGGLLFVLGGMLTTIGFLSGAVLNLVKAYQLLITTQVGSAIIGWITHFGALSTVITALTTEFLALGAAQKLAIIGISIWSGVQVKRAIDSLFEWRKAVIENKASAADWRDEMKKHEAALKEEAKSIDEVTNLTYEQALSYAKTVKEKIKYYTAAVVARERSGESAEEEIEKLNQLQNEYKVLWGVIREIRPPDAIPENVIDSYDALAESIETAQRQLEFFETTYKQLENITKEYTNAVTSWNEEIIDSKLATSDKLIALEERNVDASKIFIDKQKESVKALSEYRNAINEQDFSIAGELSKKVADLYRDAIDYGKTSLASIKRQFDEIITSAERAYKTATKEAQKYAEEVLKIERDILASKKSGEQIIRELTRQTLTEEEQWLDRKAEAEEDLTQLRKISATDDKKTLEDALRFADNIIRKYQAIATTIEAEGGSAGKTIKETTEIAKTGIEEVLRVKENIYNELLIAAQEAKSGAEEEAARIKEQLDEAVQLREAVIEVRLEGLDAVERSLDELEENIRTVKVKVETEKSGGGAVHTFAGGGRLPGESKKDSVWVKARPGEWFIKNEAAHFWNRLIGPGFMPGINNPFSQAGERIRQAVSGIQNFNLGGMVKSMLPRFAEGGTMAFDSSKLANALRKIESLASASSVRSLEMQSLGRLELGIGGRIYPVLGEVATLDQLKSAIEKENLVRSNS